MQLGLSYGAHFIKIHARLCLRSKFSPFKAVFDHNRPQGMAVRLSLFTYITKTIDCTPNDRSIIMNSCIEHFIIRRGTDDHAETIVPLIAVDQLPDWIQLAGVPREITAGQATDLINLGVAEKEGEDTIYEVHLRSDILREILNPTDEEGKQGNMSGSSSSTRGKKMSSKKRTILPLSGPGKDTVKRQKDAAATEVDGLILAEQKAHKKTKATATTKDRHVSSSTSSSSDTIPFDSTASRRGKPLGATKQKTKAKDHRQQQQQQQQVGPAAAEPKLSASRHNPENDDRPLRSLHLRHPQPQPQPPRRAITAARPRFFGTNPDTHYCRHWCHHGTCKWDSECRYEHTMPTTQEGLREIGLKDFPMWYLLMMAGGGGSPVVHVASATSTIRNNHFNHPNPILPAAVGQELSPLEMRLLQGRMSALFAGGGRSMSNRQKLREIKEIGDHVARRGASALPFPEPVRRATVHTNASLAANAERLAKDAERRRQVGSHMELEGRLSPVDSEGRRAVSLREEEEKLVELD